MKDRARGGRSVVLLSGGLDSAVAAAVARAESSTVHALTVLYGQRHAIEIECARSIVASLGLAEHRLLSVDLAGFGGSSLTGEGDVPKDRPFAALGEGVPSTYVPARNTVLLALALAWAEVLDAASIFIGAHTQDAGGYPDTKPDFIEAFERLAALATRKGRDGRGPVVRAPLLHLSKGGVIRLGQELGVDFGQTSSCYDPTVAGAPCGRCDACSLRRRGFAEAGILDPRAERFSPK